MKHIDAIAEKYPLAYISTVLLAAVIVPALIEAYL